jgi:hypothetical protein
MLQIDPRDVHETTGLASIASPLAAARSMPPPSLLLAGLGPVLLVCCPPLRTNHAWVLCHSVDSLGVREFIDAGGQRVYRLPDSDYLGWERLAGGCESRAIDAVRRPDPRRRLASVARVHAGRWQPVTRLSELGWELTRHLLHLESACRCAAAWRA